MRFEPNLKFLADADDETRRAFEKLLGYINMLAAHLDVGDGVPTHTPDGPAAYFNRTGGVGTAIYFWDTSSWTAVA